MKAVLLSSTLSLLLIGRVWAAPVPLLRIEEPTDGQILESYIVNLKFSLKNFTLKDYRTTLKNNPNQGHLLIWLDKEERKKDQATKYFKASPYIMADVLPGNHTLVVELVNNDSRSFDPKISQTIKFETRAPKGSEASPAIPTDQPKVAETTTGEVPPELVESKDRSAYAKYFLASGLFLVLGIIGLLILRKGSSSVSNPGI